jgi:hypothetical protein
MLVVKKGLTIFDKYTEKENNVTKALIELLRYSETRLTELFIREFLDIEQLNMETIKSKKFYDLQIGSKLNGCSGLGYVVGISDEKNNRTERRINSLNSKNTIPDAIIRLNNITILIEAKVYNARIDEQQIKDHEKKFAESVDIQPPIYCSWQAIYDFFYDLANLEINQFNEMTSFFLKNFLAFCENMGLTKVKSENYIYTYFSNRPNVLATIINIDEFLKGFNFVHFNLPIKDCFGYKLIKEKRGNKIYTTNKFFSSTTYKKGTYILHLTSAEDATVLQRKLNKQFKGNKKYNEKEYEVHINMNLVESFEQIKPYVLIALNDILKKNKKNPISIP